MNSTLTAVVVDGLFGTVGAPSNPVLVMPMMRALAMGTSDGSNNIPGDDRGITPSSAPAALWGLYVALALVGITIQLAFKDKLLAKAERLRVMARSMPLSVERDVRRAPRVVQGLFSFLWLLSSVLRVTNPLYYGFFAGGVFNMCVVEFLNGVDLFVADAPAMNLMYLKKCGYSYWTSALMVRIAMFVEAFGSSNAIATNCVGAVPRVDVGLIVGLATVLLSSESVFYPCHKAMHRVPWLARFHVAHHCCRACCYSTRLVAHPVDIVAEFTLPNVLAGFICMRVLNDPWLMVVVTWAMAAWYSVDHDHFLGLPHVSHHTWINQNYFIYLSKRETNPKLDAVRPLVM